MSNDDYPSLILLFNLVWKENQAQMVQNRMMNLSSSQELPHLKPKAFRPSWLLPGKSIHFDLPSYFDFGFLASAHSLCYAKKELDPI